MEAPLSGLYRSAVLAVDMLLVLPVLTTLLPLLPPSVGVTG